MDNSFNEINELMKNTTTLYIWNIMIFLLKKKKIWLDI